MSDRSKKHFTDHRRTAKVRGIDFMFTYDEWLAWWHLHLGPTWREKRGCKKGQYVMARYYDDGPYAPHNVKCILSEDNHTEYNLRRKRVTGFSTVHLQDEIVIAIFKDERPYSEIAKTCGVKNHTIYGIKKKHNYKSILDELT